MSKIDKFRFLEHTADVKFQAFGKTKEEVFENAADAMFTVLSDSIIEPKTKKSIKVSGKDDESLMYNFLEELLFLFDTEHFMAGEIKVKIKDNELTAEMKGDDAKHYPMEDHVKAVTYNEMFIKQDKKEDKWVCQVVLDV